MKATLDTEMATFRRELPRLLAEGHEGSFALIRGEKVIGVYPSFDAGLSEGYDKFGIEPFMVHKIVEHEKPKYFSRNLRCPS